MNNLAKILQFIIDVLTLGINYWSRNKINKNKK